MISAGLHPNAIPVVCKNKDDMRKLAQQMRSAAAQDPDVADSDTGEPFYQGSKTEGEAKLRAAISYEEMLDKGFLRFIDYPDSELLVNVCFTLLETDNKEWNLSISHATRQGPLRVNDELVTMIAEAFLDTGYREIETQAFWKTIRHFVKIEEK